MKFKEATIFGVTGLIGSEILKVLIDDISFKKINIVTRTSYLLTHEKIKNHIIDFSDYTAILKTIENSDIVFAAIGTTQSKVKGDKKAYRKIDYDIVLDIAKACKESNTSHFSFVSSAGADLKSNSFYLKLKGEIENAILNLNLLSTSVLRPSLLLGKRKEKRFGEKIAQLIMPILSSFMPSIYRPIKANLVAKSMIEISKSAQPGFNIYHFNEIQKIKVN